MVSLGISAIWASLLLYLTVRAEKGYRDWLALRKPPAEEEIQDIRSKLADLQSQVSRLAIDKQFEE